MFTTFTVSPLLKAVAASRIGGFPSILLLALLVVAASAWVLDRSVYGRLLSAVGQNRQAADLSGVPAAKVTAIAFVISGVLASLDGMLLAAYSGGAFLELGTPYLLQSVGAVVVGGTLIFGGSATALGTFMGSILLVLIVTTMQIARLPGGAQDVVQGAVIIFVLAAAGSGALRRG